jgi:hypothetical protein
MIRQRGVASGKQVIPGWWIDDINDNGDPEAWARGDFAELLPGAAIAANSTRSIASGRRCAVSAFTDSIFTSIRPANS